MAWYKPWTWKKKEPTYIYKPPAEPPPPGVITPTTVTPRTTGETPTQYAKRISGGRGAPSPTIAEIARAIEAPPKAPTPPPPIRTITEQLAGKKVTMEGMIPAVQTAYEKRMKEKGFQEAMMGGIIAPAPFWLKKYPSKVKGAILELGMGAEQVISLGGLLEYKPTKAPTPFAPEIMEAPPGMGGLAGTTIFRPPTEIEMTPKQKIESISIKAGTTAYIKSELISQQLAEKYQSEIYKGELTVTQAQTKYEKEYREKLEPVEKKYKERLKKAEKIYGAEVMKAALPLTFAKGVVFGGISAIAPPIGLGMAGIGVAGMAFKYKAPGGLREQFGLYPGLTIAHFGVGLVGATTGALGTGLAYGKVRGYVTTFGKKPIVAERLIRPSILKGKEIFPTAPTRVHLKIFKKPKYKLPGEVRLGVWHAAPEKFAKQFIVRAGKRRPGEPPGLYVSPEVSPYFLRITGANYKFFGLGMKSILEGRPGILRIYPKGIVKGIKERIGYAELPLTKPEIQAILPLSTQLKRIGSRYYTTWKGEQIPIYQYEALGLGRAVTGKRITTLGKIYQQYYYKPSGVSLVTPSSILYSLGVSKYYKPSKISYLKKPYYGISLYYKKPYYEKPYYVSKITKPYYPYYPYKLAPPYVPPYYPPTKYPPIFPPPIKKIFRDFERKKRFLKAFKKIPQPQKYVPSLTASILRIVGKKKPYVVPKRFHLGFLPGIRPIIKRKRKKSKH